METRNKNRKIRSQRIRKKIFGSAKRPRLCIFRSNRYIYAQVINDTEGKTIVSANDLSAKKGSTKDRVKMVGEEIAKKCLAKKINEVVFDRAGYKYTGIIKEFCEAARKKGLKF